MAGKQFKDLDLKDAFLFAAALQDAETCQMILEIILGENRCLERDFSLGDETFRIFLNTRGNNDREVPKLLVDFLHYVEKSNDEYVGTVSDEKIGQLHEKIRKLKESREWEARYMTFERLLQKSEEKGREEGLKEGQQKILKVMECMIASGEAEKIPELTKDETLLEQMLKKYNL